MSPGEDLTDKGSVIYSVKDNKKRKIFDAQEWLAAMCSHVPNRSKQMVIYYEFFNTIRDYKFKW
ncbi:MAG: hypothetical protein A2168_04145 [Planctomycetes bacterium RBG_13_50_24]|nr:MAG: hypothetical protein A2168_04145 [Planctomycetes bacterium RBG_13_50_24]